MPSQAEKPSGTHLHTDNEKHQVVVSEAKGTAHWHTPWRVPRPPGASISFLVQEGNLKFHNYEIEGSRIIACYGRQNPDTGFRRLGFKL